jgi:hypothetical protein
MAGEALHAGEEWPALPGMTTEETERSLEQYRYIFRDRVTI